MAFQTQVNIDGGIYETYREYQYVFFATEPDTGYARDHGNEFK